MAKLSQWAPRHYQSPGSRASNNDVVSVSIPIRYRYDSGVPGTLDITTLRSLVAVSACGGFHRAAHALHLTQAAVSRHVQRLEDTLGRELVERDGRGVRFTAAGEEFLTHARAILDTHDAALEHFTGPRRRAISVGSMDHAADELLPELVHSLRDALPDHDVQFRVARSATLRESFEHHRLDVAIVLDRMTYEPDGHDTIPTRWLAAAGWAPPDGEPVPLVLFDHHCGLRSAALDTLTDARVRHRISAEAPDLTGIHAATRAGLGLTLLPAIGRPPDKLTVAATLPRPPHVAYSVRISSALTARDARTITAVVRRLLRHHLTSS